MMHLGLPTLVFWPSTVGEMRNEFWCFYNIFLLLILAVVVCSSAELRMSSSRAVTFQHARVWAPFTEFSSGFVSSEKMS